MRKVILFALLTLLITGFILGNSVQTVEQSDAQSTQVAEFLQPVLNSEKEMKTWEFRSFVRKLAHVAEFFLLGLVVAGFGISLSSYLNKGLISLPILMVLLVAVVDEYIQHFTHRGSLVTDVVLDFFGSVAALGLVYLLVTAWSLAKRRSLHH